MRQRRDDHNYWCMECPGLIRYDEITKDGKCPHCGYARIRPLTKEEEKL